MSADTSSLWFVAVFREVWGDAGKRSIFKSDVFPSTPTHKRKQAVSYVVRFRMGGAQGGKHFGDSRTEHTPNGNRMGRLISRLPLSQRLRQKIST